MGHVVMQDKHEKFCIEYVKELNSTKAYKIAFGDTKGAAPSASRLLTQDHIRERITELLREYAGDELKNAGDIVRRLASHANFNIFDVFESNGKEVFIKDFDNIPREVGLFIKHIETVTNVDKNGGDMTRISKVTFYDKVKILDMLSRHHSVYNDKVTVEHKTIEQVIAEAKGTK